MHSDPSRPEQPRPATPRGQPTVSPRKRSPATASRALGAVAGASFSARYSDGRTAVAHAAQVSIDDRALTIALGDGGDPVVWPLASLRTAQPLTRRSLDVLVGRIGDETETLFVADAAFARALAAAAPALTGRSQRWRHARPWLAVGALAALGALAMAKLDLSPARAVARLLPDTARQRMGDEAIRSMTKGHAVCTSTSGRAALDRLSSRLATSLPADEAARFKIVVVDWSLMNAFAVPGGKIVLTRGLIAKAESGDEVAGVLAHEMGHGIELHPEAAMVRALGMTAVADLLFGSGTMTNIGLMLAELSYSRDAERQADMQGLALLKKAGIAPQGLADFFRRVTRSESRSGKTALPGRALDVLSTHPATEERMRMVEHQPTYAASPALSSEDWQALRGICAAPGVTSPSATPPAGPRGDKPRVDPGARTTTKPPTWGSPPAGKPAPGTPAPGGPTPGAPAPGTTGPGTTGPGTAGKPAPGSPPLPAPKLPPPAAKPAPQPPPAAGERPISL